MPEQTDILSTARNPHSQGPAGELKTDTLVHYGGMQISLQSAERLGLVRKDVQGGYQVAGI